MASNIPNNLKFTKEHEWMKVEGTTGTIGITDFAQSALGDIVFVELPEVGKKLTLGKTFGVVESIKSVSDLYAPVSGEVIERNENVAETPDLINKAPYDQWLIKIKILNPSELSTLMGPEEYSGICH
ncbi:MAG: glycine cleavage system protein H [Bdellovibrionales bacterium GWA2_49_15]|nr:MAG: glycine cleavage system protein H [Bdellovibrionales bacterium GWA2_49_15]